MKTINLSDEQAGLLNKILSVELRCKLCPSYRKMLNDLYRQLAGEDHESVARQVKGK